MSLSRDHNGKLAVGLGVRGLEQKMMENYAAKKIYAYNLVRDANEVLPNKADRFQKSTENPRQLKDGEEPLSDVWLYCY